MANSIQAAPSVLADAVIGSIKYKLPVLSGFSSVFSSSIAGQGKTIQVPLIGTSTATEFSTSGYLTQDDATVTKADVTLKHFKVSTRVTPLNIREYGMAFFQNFAVTAANALSQKCLDEVAALVTNANYSSNTTTGASLSYAEAVASQKTLDDAGAAQPRALVLNSTYIADLRGDSSIVGANGFGANVIQSGNIGRLIPVFATAFNNMVNQYYVAGATGDYKKLASHVFWLAGVTTVAMMAMEALRGGAPEDEEYLDWYMKNTIGHMLDLNPMTRLFRGTIQDGREAQVAAMRPPIAAAKAAYNATQGEWDRAGRNMVKALPMVGPFPTVAAIRAFEGASQIVDGDHVEGARHATLGTANPEKRK